MEKQMLMQFLQSTGLISPLKAQEIAVFFNATVVRRHEFFLQEGKVSNEYLFLNSGFMRSYAVNTEGADITTNFYNKGSVVFEVSSFFNRIPSKENIVALTDCEGCSISFEQLNNLFHTLPEFREFGRSILVNGYAGLKERTLSMITDTAEERYATLLKNKPEIFQQAPLKHIASYLGITDTSLSRIRKELGKKERA